MTADTLPTVQGEITAAWLSSVLGHKITSVRIRHVLPGTATKVFVTVTYDSSSSSSSSSNNGVAAHPPTSLCIKGGFNPGLIAAMPFVVTIYQREVDFYTHVAPSLELSAPINLPKTWLASQGVIVMDDLAAAGHTFGTPSVSWSVAAVLAGVEQLAALHAKTWGVTPEKYPWLRPADHYDQALLHLMQTYEQVVMSPDRPPNVPSYMKDQARVTAVLKKHYASRNPRFRCLLHGDAHVSNTYLEDKKPRFLDWQMVHIGSAFHDVAYFVGGALDVETRRANEMGILEHYLVTLGKFGGPVLEVGDQEVVTEYKKGLLAGIGPIMCPYEMQPREWVFPMAQRYAAALDDHKVLELVEELP